MEKEKYVITIDGPDCTGKSTLFDKTSIDIQIRGIVSNIAYALKYNRNVDELIRLYNEKPVNYVVYLLNPTYDKKLEMLMNRLQTDINDSKKFKDDLKEACDTWYDYEYFEKAIHLLKVEYKGKLEIIEAKDNDFGMFKEATGKFVSYDLEELEDVPSIKILETIDNFEEEAKKISEYKYIVLFRDTNPDNIMTLLYDKLSNEYKTMYDMLLDYTDMCNIDVYNDLSSYTVDDLIDYLDNYEFRVQVDIRADIETDMECYIPLKDYHDKNCSNFEEYIYDNESLHEEAVDAIRDAASYTDDIEIDVESVR